MNTYGVLTLEHGHVDVSKSELGAKQYATRNGYDQISVRYNCGYICKVVSQKINGKWVNKS